jgi:hypothetical protein
MDPSGHPRFIAIKEATQIMPVCPRMRVCVEVVGLTTWITTLNTVITVISGRCFGLAFLDRSPDGELKYGLNSHHQPGRRQPEPRR